MNARAQLQTSETKHLDSEAGYRRKLLGLLSVATFFEGYDGFVLGLALPLILANFHGSVTEAGLIKAITQVGTVLAFFLAAQIDRIGRRRLLLITVVGYTAATAVTAFAPNLAALAAAQFVAQIFLGAEWAAAVTLVVEEFPTEHRGRGLGILTSMGTLGGITAGLAGFVGLGSTALGWRAFYLVGLAPLVLVAIARRSMRESPRYAARRTGASPSNILAPWRSEHRRSVLTIGLIHFFRYLSISAAVFFFSTYAIREVHLSFRMASLDVAAAGLVGALGFVMGGRLIDRYGRRPVFLVYMALAMVSGVALFQTGSKMLLLPALCAAIFFGLGSGCMTSAFATESFPTEIRGRAAAWCKNAFEIPGGIAGPLLAGFLADHVVGSIGTAMTILFVASGVPVLWLAWRYAPETRARELDGTPPERESM
jgi:putative MFS transporter